MTAASSTETGLGAFLSEAGPARRALYIILAILVVGLAIIAVFALQVETGWASVAAVGFALAGASMLVGALIGLLFGIPRRLQQQEEPVAEQEPTSEQLDETGAGHARQVPSNAAVYAANTNLEQISDWLTKILVGVGLIHLPKLGGFLVGMGNFVKPGLGDMSASTGFAVAIVIYFFVGGFLIGYLATRLYLGQALAAAERTYSLEKQLSERERRLRTDAIALALADAQLEGAESELPGQKELLHAIRTASRDTRALIFYRTQTQRKRNARDEASRSKMERTLPIFRALVAGDVDDEFHANHAELGFVLKDQRVPDWKAAEDAFSRAIAIRGNDPDSPCHIYEASRALCRIMQDPGYCDNQPASEELRGLVVADLKYAVQNDETKNWIKSTPEIRKWLTLNKLDLDNLP